MIKKLRIKFVCITLGGILLVLIAVFTGINIYMMRSSQRQTQQVLDAVIDNDSRLETENLKRSEKTQAGKTQFPKAPPETSADGEETDGSREKFFDKKVPDYELLRTANIFYLKYDANGEIFDVRIYNLNELTEDEAVALGNSILKKNRTDGSVGSYQYTIAQKEWGTFAVFVARDTEILMLRKLVVISVAVIFVSSVVFLILVMFLERWATAPVEVAFQRQKQFISDASHELKTPITIVAANVDVLENEIGENKWLTYIREQNDRMKALVSDLLTLAKTDEDADKLVFCEFDLSAAASNTVLAFESIAFESEKSLSQEIQPGIKFKGSERKLKQLMAILTDNAVKHSGRQGRIEITLRKSGNHVYFEAANTFEGMPPEEIEKLFERFYRSDSSRSRETGGYGLGLAIAASIVTLHHGRIDVQEYDNPDSDGENNRKWIKFTVTLG